MHGTYVVPGAHDDVESRGAGDPGQSQRVATDTHGGRVDYGTAARPHVEHRLGGGLLLVDQHEVIEVGEGVVSDPAEVLHADGLVSPELLGGLGRLVEHAGEVDQEVLVGRRRPEVFGLDDAEDGLDFAAQIGHFLPPPHPRIGSGAGFNLPPRGEKGLPVSQIPMMP